MRQLNEFNLGVEGEFSVMLHDALDLMESAVADFDDYGNYDKTSKKLGLVRDYINSMMQKMDSYI